MINLTKITIRRPIATSMVFATLVLLGLFSSRLIPLEKFPEVDAPFVMVVVPYPGSTPDEVEENITRPLEEVLATIPGVLFLNTTASADSANAFMIFDWGVDIGTKTVEVRERVEALRGQMPSDVRRINVMKFSTTDAPLFVLRVSSERDLSNAYDMLMRNLIRPLERLPGVAKVELQGLEPKEIAIELDPERVEAHRVDLPKLGELLSSQNFAISGGRLSHPRQRLQINIDQEIVSVEEYANLVIREDGLKLKDIADVKLQSQPRNYGRHLDQSYAIGINIYKERGANLVELGDRVLAEIDRIGNQPEMNGIQLFFLQNQAEGVSSSLSQLLSAGALGALFSVFVLYLFLRDWRTTLMVTLSVPIAITITLGAMYLLGVTLNVLSMMGLMLAVGMLVDNAVVVSESIFQQRAQYPNDPLKASVVGTKQVGLAVTAGTLTTMIVFLPNIFGEQNNVSVFLSHVAVAITIALFVSLLISQTIIPLLSARMKVPPSSEGGVWMKKFSHSYGRLLAWTLKHRWISIILIVAIVGSFAIPQKFVKTDMFPQDDSRQLFLRYNLHQNYPLRVVEPRVTEIENYLYAHQEEFEITSVYSYFDENGNAQSSIKLTDEKDARRNAKDLKDAIRENLPQIAIGNPSFDEERVGASEGIKVYLRGESSEVLAKTARNVIRALDSIEGIVDIRTQSSTGELEAKVRVERQKASRLGFDTQQIAQNLSLASRGLSLREFQSNEGEIPVQLRFNKTDFGDVSQLQELRLSQANGERVPLQNMVDVDFENGPVRISRNNRRTVLSIEMALKDLSAEDAREEIKDSLDAIVYPAGYSWSFGRSFDDAAEAENKMATDTLLAIIMIFVVMAALFESMLYPLAIITSILFSIIGVFWFFLITNTTFTLMAMIGILVLIGVVVNNGIVLVEHINTLRKEGEHRDEAIVKAGRERLRPILMTVGTTVLGLVPLAISTSQLAGDGPSYFPMARAIIGGLLFSTVVSLIMLPTIYVLLDNLRRWARAIWKSTERKGGVQVPAALDAYLKRRSGS